jgi:hypothetical protein
LPIAATIQALLSEYSKGYEVEDSELTRVDEPPPRTTEKEKNNGLRARLRRRKDDDPLWSTFEVTREPDRERAPPDSSVVA